MVQAKIMVLVLGGMMVLMAGCAGEGGGGEMAQTMGGETKAHATMREGADAVSDFVVRPVGGGEAFRLSEARGKFVVLHFLLKTACPYCQRYTHLAASRGDELANTVQVFLKPDAPEATMQWMKGLEPMDQPYTIYRDPDARLAERFGIPGGYAFHGEVVHYPALVVIDPKGREVFRYVGKSNADRYDFDTLKEKIAQLNEEYD